MADALAEKRTVSARERRFPGPKGADRGAAGSPGRYDWMTDVAEVLDAPNIAPDLIREHVRMIQLLAEPLKDEGKIVIACFGEAPDQIDPKTKKPGRRLQPNIFHVDVGDVDHAARGICNFAVYPHYNIYMPLAVFRPDLAAGGKGFERDVVACLG